jgi:hypothetical protein
MQIHVTAYDDANGNSAADAGEPKATVRTKVARLASYVNAPN